MVRATYPSIYDFFLLELAVLHLILFDCTQVVWVGDLNYRIDDTQKKMTFDFLHLVNMLTFFCFVS